MFITCLLPLWGFNQWFSTLAAHSTLADPEEIRKLPLEKGKYNF